MATEVIRPKSRHPEIRRDELLDAAAKLFAKRGILETTVADIAEEAGVAKGTFYLYYPSKDHCIAALKRRLADELVDRFLGALAPYYDMLARGEADIDVEAVTRRLLDESFDYAAATADIHHNLFHRGNTIEVDEVALEAEETITSVIAQAFVMMNQMGVADVVQPTHTARILFSGVHWALEHILRTRDLTELDNLKEAAVACVMGTVRRN
jgi:AcrR family transcriptional regulator